MVLCVQYDITYIVWTGFIEATTGTVYDATREGEERKKKIPPLKSLHIWKKCKTLGERKFKVRSSLMKGVLQNNKL